METVKKKVSEDRDLGEVFRDNEYPLLAWMKYKIEEVHRVAESKFIPILRIKVTDNGFEEYVFDDFDLDLSGFTHVPIQNGLLIQNLEDVYDKQRVKDDAIVFEGFNPPKVILKQSYTFVERVGLYAAYAEKTQSVLFDGIKRGVFNNAKIDSLPELVLARVLDNDIDVQNSSTHCKQNTILTIPHWEEHLRAVFFW